MLVVVLIWLWLITVIDALQNSNNYLQKTKQKIIAINLAREWVEQMINIRNTNRQKRAWDKEISWLKTNPSINENPDLLSNDPRFGSWNYIILTTTIDDQQYFYASVINQDLIIQSWTSETWNLQYSLCETWWIWKACPWEFPQSNEWYYFRRIEWKWLFAKESTITGGEPLNCPTGWDYNCSNSSAKEFRFCSIVEYIWNWIWKVELCSVLTNFKE